MKINSAKKISKKEQLIRVKKILNEEVLRLKGNGENDRARLVIAKLNNFERFFKVTPRFLSVATMLSFALSSLFSVIKMTGKVVSLSGTDRTELIGIGFFVLGLALALAYIKQTKKAVRRNRNL